MDKTIMAELEERSRPITEEQRSELRWRLADYRVNPDEPVMTLADIRREVVLTNS